MQCTRSIYPQQPDVVYMYFGRLIPTSAGTFVDEQTPHTLVSVFRQPSIVLKRTAKHERFNLWAQLLSVTDSSSISPYSEEYGFTANDPMFTDGAGRPISGRTFMSGIDKPSMEDADLLIGLGAGIVGLPGEDHNV